jgi:hypothetical protein
MNDMVAIVNPSVKTPHLMDHLSLPTDSLARCAPEIAYVYQDGFTYDRGDFYTYPERAGINIRHVLSAKEIDCDGLAPFFQAWLWFGLIEEVIGKSLPSEDNCNGQLLNLFVTIDQNGRRILNTCALLSALSKTEQRHPQRPANHVARILQKVRCVITDVTSTPTWRSYLELFSAASPLPITFTVLLSVQVLEETLRCSLGDEYTSLIPKTPQSSTSPYSLCLLHCLLKCAGWCPHRVTDLPRSVRTLYYLTFITPYGYQEHYQCTRETCNAMSPEQPLPQFHPVHSTPDCHCGFIEIHEDILEAIHDAREIPVLTFVGSQGRQRRLEITRLRGLRQAHTIRQYVAISHVRHLGLGNLLSTSLPYCQLASLQMLANESLGTERAPFWIDTMCLPLDRERRISSLRQVSSIYKLATKVVVLDPSMYQHAVDSAEECLIRIRYSAWKDRLWTLQEGVVAQELYFQFKNKTVGLVTTVREYEAGLARLLHPVRMSHTPDINWLHYALDGLAIDMKGIDWKSQAGLSSKKMARVLRLGYLAFPIYRYFCEESESRYLDNVVDALQGIYPISDMHSLQLPVEERSSQERLRILEASITFADG